MISKVISISEKVNGLSLFGRLLYTWMIPHTDDFGRMTGSPAKVRALVVPMGEETISEVEQALREMSNRGLIQWYEVDGERFVQIINFDEHQQGLHKRTKSKFPDPPSEEDEIPGSSGKFTNIPSELELNRTESTTTTTTAREVFKVFEQEGFGTISTLLVDDINDAVDTYSELWVIRAMKEAASVNKRNWKYALAILKRWKAEGIDSPWERNDSHAKSRASPTRSRGEYDFLSH